MCHLRIAAVLYKTDFWNVEMKDVLSVMLFQSQIKVMDSGDVPLPSGEVICQLLPSGVYKYLGIMECDTVKNQLMKSLLSKEYKRHVRKLLCTKLTSRIPILVVMCIVSLLHYSGGIVNWTQSELYSLDVMTKKQFTMHKRLQNFWWLVSNQEYS